MRQDESVDASARVVLKASRSVHGSSRARRATSMTASAARRLAPGAPKLSRAPRRGRAARRGVRGSVSTRSASSATALGRELVLNQLGHDAPAGDEIGHRVGVDVDERLAEAIRQRRQPIDDDHRALVQRRLHGHGAGRDERHVGARQHVVGRALRRPAARRRRPARSSGANSSSSRCGARATTNCTRRHALAISAAARDEIGQDRAQLVAPAARAAARRRAGAGSSPSARRNASRGCGGTVSVEQRMADPLRPARRPLVDRHLERKDHQHAIGDRAASSSSARGARPTAAG